MNVRIRGVELKGQTFWKILSVIRNKGVCTSNDLVRELGLAKTSVIDYLNNLERLGLVESWLELIPGTPNGIKKVRLTEKGIKFLKKLEEIERKLEEVNAFLYKDIPCSCHTSIS